MDDLSQSIRSFNRFELKYVIPLQHAERIKAALRAYLIPDNRGAENGRYSLASLYYDSPDLRCYWEKEYGVRFRRKLRLRRYETGELLTEETPVFVEIKQRVDRVTQKRRVALPYGDALRLCNDRQLPAPESCALHGRTFTDADKRVIDEVFAFVWNYNLRPTSIVRYDRQAFVGTEYDIGLRVTFDTSLSFQLQPLYLHEQPSSLPMMPPGLVVMEVKANERIPSWLTELIAAHNLPITRISKYCRSIDVAEKMPALAWRRLPAESSREVLSSAPALFSSLRRKMGMAVQA